MASVNLGTNYDVVLLVILMAYSEEVWEKCRLCGRYMYWVGWMVLRRRLCRKSALIPLPNLLRNRNGTRVSEASFARVVNDVVTVGFSSFERVCIPSWACGVQTSIQWHYTQGQDYLYVLHCRC